MPKQQSFDEFEREERKWTDRFCALFPLLTLSATTAIGSGLCYDAVIESGATRSVRRTEVKLREDLSPYPTILLDRWKWERLMELANPTFIAFCRSSLSAYVFDLNRAEPLAKTLFIRTPVDYANPNGPKELVECVQLRKHDADHHVNLRSISPKHR